MKVYCWILFLLLIFSFGFSQTNCELCVEQNGFYCGDDESNWTQYSPNGCVPNGLNNLFYLNDGWEDCVDASDEQDSIPTTLADCQQYVIPCDTIYINTIDTLYITQYIDCESGLPCNIGLEEILEKSKTEKKLYNLSGKEIGRRNGVYIENGIIKIKID